MVQSQQTVLPWWGERWHVPAFVLFLVAWVNGAIVPFFQSGFADDWTIKLFLGAAVLTSLITMGRQLPLQNVVVTGLLLSVAAAGWAEFTDTSLDWRGTTWRTTVFWTVVFLNVRGVAQFFLQVRRGSRFYGWELTGASAWVFMCSVVFLKGILYQPIGLLMPVSFFGTIALFVLLLPLMINKRPAEAPVSWQPIVVLPLLLSWAYLPRV